MPTIATNLIPATKLPLPPNGVSSLPFVFTMTGTATLADNGDDISWFALPAGYGLLVKTFNVSATLGASCTAQLRIGTTALTAATTAGGADTELATAVSIAPTTAARTVNILVGGADIAAAANFVLVGEITRPATYTTP